MHRSYPGQVLVGMAVPPETLTANQKVYMLHKLSSRRWKGRNAFACLRHEDSTDDLGIKGQMHDATRLSKIGRYLKGDHIQGGQWKRTLDRGFVPRRSANQAQLHKQRFSYCASRL